MTSKHHTPQSRTNTKSEATRRAFSVSVGVAVAIVAVLVFFTFVVTPASATSPVVAEEEEVPPKEEENGMENGSFHGLWSHEAEGSIDDTEDNQWLELRNATDYVFSEPPDHWEDWNARDISDYPFGGTFESVHPPTADLEDYGDYIRDAHVSLFAIQPSTVALIEPSREEHFVGPEGEILGVTDWRVELPEEKENATYRESYEVERSGLENVTSYTRYLSGVERVTEEMSRSFLPSKRFSLSFSIPPEEYLTPDHTLGVEAEINVTVKHTVETRECEERNYYGDCAEYSEWTSSTTYETDLMTINSELDVKRQDLNVGWLYTNYPDGDVGLVATSNGDYMSSIQFYRGDRATGLWNFYSGRDTDWDTLRSTEQEQGEEDVSTEEFASPALPVQLYAFPKRDSIGMSGSPSSTDLPEGEVFFADGQNLTAPNLPETVDAEVVTGAYNNAESIAIRHPTDNIFAVFARGIVRNVREPSLLREENRIEMHETELKTEVLNQTKNTMTVEVTLTTTDGKPVPTEGRKGYVVVGDTIANTDTEGKAIVTVEKRTYLNVRYKPAYFWEHQPAFAETTAYVRADAGFSRLFGLTIILLVVMLLFWSPLYALDQYAEGSWWPPWEGIW